MFGEQWNAMWEWYGVAMVFWLLAVSAMFAFYGWVEYTVYPLYSPQSFIAEGTANFGIEVAFPGPERVAYERETLFPLAGLDSARAEQYYTVQGLAQQRGAVGDVEHQQVFVRRRARGRSARFASRGWRPRGAGRSRGGGRRPGCRRNSKRAGRRAPGE